MTPMKILITVEQTYICAFVLSNISSHKKLTNLATWASYAAVIIGIFKPVGILNFFFIALHQKDLLYARYYREWYILWYIVVPVL